MTGIRFLVSILRIINPPCLYRIIPNNCSIRMKRVSPIITVLLATVVVSCTNFQEAEIPVSFGVNTTELSFLTGGDSRSVTVSSGKKWDVPAMPQWISLQSITRSGISPYEWTASFSAASNEEYNREGRIVIKAGSETAEISVSQDGKKGRYVALESVSVSPSELTLTEGDNSSLSLVITPSNASVKTVSWKSSSPTVATVSQSGRIDALAEGTTLVTVTTEDGGKTASCAVTVKAKVIPVSGITLDKTSLNMTEGDEQTLSASITPSNATDKSVTWSSSNSSVALVSSSGVVTAKSAGTATITVTTTDGGKKATCSVTVQAKTVSVTGVSLNKTSLSMTVGDTQTLTATVTPSNATDKSVSWSSSNASVAAVSTSGVMTAIAVGSATITVTTNDGGKKATCSVTVLSTSGTENGHEWIDIGLSVRWSPYNYGASSTTDNGGYYFWGDPTGSASVYYYSAPQTYHISGTSYDIAKQQWGGEWRLPTISEVKELYTNCSWSWTTLDGKTMLKATGPNGKSIYFVPTGLMYNDSYQASDCVIILSGDSFNSTSFASYVTIFPYFYRISPDGEATEAGHSGSNCRFPIRPVL